MCSFSFFLLGLTVKHSMAREGDDLQCTTNFVCVSIKLITTKNPSSSKVSDPWVHLFIQQNVACFQIPMDDFEPRVVMQIQNLSCYSPNNGSKLGPV